MEETPARVNQEDKKEKDTKLLYETGWEGKSSIKKEMNLVPWESIKISKESLYSRENEEIPRTINFDVAGDHDSPKSIWEDDDLDFTLTDDEKAPFKLSPEVKKKTEKPQISKHNQIFLSPSNQLNASVEMSTTLRTRWEAIQASVQKA